MSSAVATATTDIDATPDRVWAALTDPALIKEYMFGTDVSTDWQVGRPIVWRGEYEGRRYEDHGEILEFEPGRRLTMTHFSPLSGAEDVPENYHRVSYELEDFVNRTHVTLTQDGNSSDEELEHATKNWEVVLDGLKKVVEQG
jgi:uncharacterized protein YndB with AHSA1/START domain